MSGSVREAVFEGRGLHTGALARVVLRPSGGGITFRAAGGREVPVSEARVLSTTRATTILVGDQRVATVEHLLAAFGGMGAHAGVSIEVSGPELPLLDGGARAYCDAFLGAVIGRGELGQCALEVAEDGEVRVGPSRYVFERARSTGVHVTIDFGDPRLAADARWDGDPRDFRERIAPARTFAFARELPDLARQGLAGHVDPGSVVVLGEHEVLSSGRPFLPDEPARHKLLDLVGDLFLHGGPPRGVVRAHRPGHAATHAAVREAFARGILASPR